MTIGEFSIIFSVAGAVPYIQRIVRGNVRPERMTWFTWSAILAIAIWGYRANGANDSVWFLVGDFVITFSIFLLSLWRGKAGLEKLDIACFIVALMGVMVWQTSHHSVFSVIGAMLADTMALIPTLIKSLKKPQTESAATFAGTTLAAICGILAVGQWNLTLLSYPVYLFLANFTTAIVVVVGQYHASNVPGKKIHKPDMKVIKKRIYKPQLWLSRGYHA